MIPAYDELPRDETVGLPHSWGIFEPNLGTLALTSPSIVAEAAASVQTGECIPLNLSLGLIDPPLFGRTAFSHSVHQVDRNTFEDELNAWNPQGSSQWDGFRHVRAREAGFYGGVTDLESGHRDQLSIEHFARRGIAGRGVLLDVVRWCTSIGRRWDPFAGDVLDASDLARVAADQAVELRTGDILCIRLGWVGAYKTLDPRDRADDLLSNCFSGLRGDEGTARFLWDHHVAAVCTDNPAVESAPGNRDDGSLHRRLLPMLGVLMGELLDLDMLADRCADSGRYDFLFVAVPLPVPGGLSSPANAMAIL